MEVTRDDINLLMFIGLVVFVVGAVGSLYFGHSWLASALIIIGFVMNAIVLTIVFYCCYVTRKMKKSYGKEFEEGLK